MHLRSPTSCQSSGAQLTKPSHSLPAATLLQSSNQAYQHGVAGPFWYAAGATIQIILFGILAVMIKMKAPSAHTVLEIVHARWGNVAHLVFFFFCFLTNIIVSAMLILGGAAVMTALTGINTVAVSAAGVGPHTSSATAEYGESVFRRFQFSS